MIGDPTQRVMFQFWYRIADVGRVQSIRDITLEDYAPATKAMIPLTEFPCPEDFLLPALDEKDSMELFGLVRPVKNLDVVRFSWPSNRVINTLVVSLSKFLPGWFSTGENREDPTLFSLAGTGGWDLVTLTEH